MTIPIPRAHSVERSRSNPDAFIRSSPCCRCLALCAWCCLLPVNGGLEFEVRLRLPRRQKHSQALILDEKLAYAQFKASQSVLPLLLSELWLLHLRPCGAPTNRVQRRFLILLCEHDISRKGRRWLSSVVTTMNGTRILHDTDCGGERTTNFSGVKTA